LSYYKRFFAVKYKCFFAVKNRYITSDCGAVDIIKTRHGYAKTPEDAIADVLQAGIISTLTIIITCILVALHLGVKFSPHFTLF
jgi:hypothetical protein